MKILADIFLCHSSKDKSFVRQLANDLHNLSIVPWFDEWILEPGDSLFSCLKTAIESSIYVGVIISKNSVDSKWCQKELELAIQRQENEDRKIIIPILMEHTKIPNFLEEMVYLDFSEKYYEPFTKLCGFIHLFSPQGIDLQISKNPPKTVDDVRTILAGVGLNEGKLLKDDQKYAQYRRLAQIHPSLINLLNLGRIAFQLNKDDEAQSAFTTVLKMDSNFTTFDQIDSTVRKLAREGKPFDMAANTRVAMSYLGLIQDNEDLILNSAYSSIDKEVLINAGKYYLNTYNADIPTAIAYFIQATNGEPINSVWIQHCDTLIHQILKDKKAMYPKSSWDYIFECVQEWNTHKWKKV